jgi:hypothetical protein
MTATTPCYRHSRGTWIAACADCTAWHLAAAVGRRDQVTLLPTPAAPVATDAPAVLRLVA